MDAKNSNIQPTACSPAGGHEQVLPMLGKPAAWDSTITTTSTTSGGTIFNNYNHAHQHHQQQQPQLLHYHPPAVSSAVTTTVPAIAPSSSSLSHNPDESAAAASRSADSDSKNRQDVGKGAPSKLRKTRKTTNVSNGRSTLFWVHTDPQSVSEGTREETLKRIRSHVMSEHNRKKRLENTKRYKSKTWKHLAFQPVETTSSNSSSTTAASASAPTSASSSSAFEQNTSTSSPAISSTQHHQQAKQEHDQGQPQIKEEEEQFELVVTKRTGNVDSYSVGTSSQTQTVGRVQSRSSPPWDGLGHGGKDPFNTLHTPLSDRMYRHLQHFLCNLTRLAYPLQRRFAPRLQAHWAALVQHDPASLHACICVAASNAALESGEFPLVDPAKAQTSPLILDTFHHRGETIRLVNESLSDPLKASSDELIAAVSILLTIEIASGNPDYLKIHLAGLRQMVAMRNSFADVPPDVRFQISWTDIRVACMAFTKPIFPFVRYARPSGLTLIPPSKDHARTASRLIQLIEIPGVFGDAMSKAIYDLTELIWYAEWIKGDPKSSQSFDDETEDYFNTEVLYVEYALHTDRYTATGEAKGDATIEGCVRLACLLFHNSTIWEFYPAMGPVFSKPIIGLRVALETTIPAGYFNLCRELLIWVLFVGACSSRLLAREHTFFMTELTTALRNQGFRSWQELRELLLGYFYVDRYYLTPLRELWDEIHIDADASRLNLC
ncbi:uncharacterized protein P174DRAFT_436736 [Aspergillus novofumigatus IBT 16806]|uniref:Uncharacterized protein n=1 Tax=Aspergillus novofumigatus (strain IBT 16806) TaxID=1392255 RepID=A0A2I1CL44_ASPN1|nr:uncharacterized protein P174DRAFT_436736 [Aspergillus novofumigatus IBT 16806]PKX98335.1 hypothetical protein P174DRAFT_436736 [Aspergillus novofumigatus IBT 16806]